MLSCTDVSADAEKPTLALAEALPIIREFVHDRLNDPVEPVAETLNGTHI